MVGVGSFLYVKYCVSGGREAEEDQTSIEQREKNASVGERIPMAVKRGKGDHRLVSCIPISRSAGANCRLPTGR